MMVMQTPSALAIDNAIGRTVEMREITEIILHVSDSEFGSAKIIDSWHRERGWDSIGYHSVITNGVEHSVSDYKQSFDGIIQWGRPFEIAGAHCYGKNFSSIGICLIGKSQFTSKQLFDTLPIHLCYLFNKFHLSPKRLFGHYEFNQNKTCPNIDMTQYRKYMELIWFEYLSKEELKKDNENPVSDNSAFIA